MTKIIMAEDDIALNRLVKAYLKNAGFKVESYPDGKSALDGFFASGAALVLTDIMTFLFRIFSVLFRKRKGDIHRMPPLCLRKITRKSTAVDVISAFAIYRLILEFSPY